MTIEDEASNFVSFWEDAHNPAPVMPQDVSWEILEDWGVGNSISFDQSRLKTGRTVLQLLSKRRMLWLKQLEIEGQISGELQFRSWPGHPNEGEGIGHESFVDMKATGDDGCSSCIYFRETSVDGVGICSLWDHKVDYIEGYMEGTCDSQRDLGSGERERHYAPHMGGVKTSELRDLGKDAESVAYRIAFWLHQNDLVDVLDWAGADAGDLDDYTMLGAVMRSGGTLRLSPVWDTFIRGRHGGRDIPGELPKLARGGTVLPPVVRVDLPLVLGEVINRLVSERGGRRGIGENQYQIRSELCDQAIGRSPPYVTTSEYYKAFRDGGAPHMGDTYLHRAAQDVNSAVFDLQGHDVPPDYGRITVDSRLVRWRERNRDRGR